MFRDADQLERIEIRDLRQEGDGVSEEEKLLSRIMENFQTRRALFQNISGAIQRLRTEFLGELKDYRQSFQQIHDVHQQWLGGKKFLFDNAKKRLAVHDSLTQGIDILRAINGHIEEVEEKLLQNLAQLHKRELVLLRT